MAKRAQTKAKSATRSTAKRSTARRTAKPARAHTTQGSPARRTSTPRAAQKLGALAAKQGVPVDALRLLEQDHQEVEGLFAQFKDLSSAREKATMAAKICLLLRVHTQIEEEILYPAAREALDEDDMVDEADVEHASARKLIGQIEAMKPRDHLFDAKVNVLGEYIHHHLEEERTELFPALRGTELDFFDIGSRLAARKITLLAKLTGRA